VIELDEKTRGSIEQRFEEELKDFIENEDVYWVLDTAPMSSKKDFLLGFVVGKLTVIAWTYLPNATDEYLQEVREIIRRRLPEIQANISTELNI
jgi:hypothetical protein